MLTPICSTTTIAEVPSSLLSPIFPLVTVKSIKAGFRALVMWALPSPEKTTVKPSSRLQESAKQPGNGKAIAAGLDVGLNGKNLHHRSANCCALWYIADSHSVTLLSKLYLDVSTPLFLVLYNAGFGSDSVMRYADVIHKQPH